MDVGSKYILFIFFFLFTSCLVFVAARGLLLTICHSTIMEFNNHQGMGHGTGLEFCGQFIWNGFCMADRILELGKREGYLHLPCIQQLEFFNHDS